MYQPRKIDFLGSRPDMDGIKLYTVSYTGDPVAIDTFVPQLMVMKEAQAVTWIETPAFAIFHQGETMAYLVLCWWGNGNELFQRVAVCEDGEWVIDASRYSFCVYDLEIMWMERNSYIQTIDIKTPSLHNYRYDNPRSV